MTSSALPAEPVASGDTIPAVGEANPREFQTGKVLPVVFAHFSHDIYTAGVPPLLPVLIEKLSLSLFQAGVLSAFLQLPSLLNPLIGYLGDTVDLRLFVILAPAITATALSSIGLTSSYAVLALLFFCSGVSIACFHATGPAMVGRVAGRRVGLGMSLFMAGGELAYTLGPLLAVWAVSTWTLSGMWRIVVLGWAASLILFWRLRSKERGPALQALKSGSLRQMLPQLPAVFIPLALINLFRNPLMESISTYLPTYLSQRGTSLWLAGASLSIFDLAGLGGVLLSGTLSDKLGRKQVLVIVSLVSPLLALVFINVSGWLAIAALLGLGFFASSAMPVFLAIAQEHFPENRAMANSLVMMIVFVLRPLGTLTVGFMGDHIGLQSAFFWSALAFFLTLPAIIALPGKADKGLVTTD